MMRTRLATAVALMLATTTLAAEAAAQTWVVAQVRRTDASLAVALLPSGRSSGVSGHIHVFPKHHGELGERGAHFLVGFEFDCSSGRYWVEERRVADRSGQTVRDATDAEISRYALAASLVLPIHRNFCSSSGSGLGFWPELEANSETIISNGSEWQVP